MKTTRRRSRTSSLTTAPPYVDGIASLKDELEERLGAEQLFANEITHAEPGAFQAIKSAIKGQGEQTVLPDDCEFGDNDLCYVES